MRLDLCAEGIRLARVLAELMPGEPEAQGLLALLLLLHVPDMYMFQIYLLPINLGFIIYFTSMIIRHAFRDRHSAYPSGLR